MIEKLEQNNKKYEQLRRQLEKMTDEDLRYLILEWEKTRIRGMNGADQAIYILAASAFARSRPRVLHDFQDAQVFLQDLRAGFIYLLADAKKEDSYWSYWGSLDYEINALYDPFNLQDACVQFTEIMHSQYQEGKVEEAAGMMLSLSTSPIVVMNLLDGDILDLDYSPDYLYRKTLGDLYADLIYLFTAFLVWKGLGRDRLLELMKQKGIPREFLEEKIDDPAVLPTIRADGLQWSGFLKDYLAVSTSLLREEAWLKLAECFSPMLTSQDVHALADETQEPGLLEIPAFVPVLLEEQDPGKLLELARNAFERNRSGWKPAHQQLMDQALAAAASLNQPKAAMDLLAARFRGTPGVLSFLPLYKEHMAHPQSELYYLAVLDESMDEYSRRRMRDEEKTLIQFFSRTLYRSITALSSVKFTSTHPCESQLTFVLLLILYLQASLGSGLNEELVRLLAQSAAYDRNEKPDSAQMADTTAQLKEAIAIFAGDQPLTRNQIKGTVRGIIRHLSQYLSIDCSYLPGLAPEKMNIVIDSLENLKIAEVPFTDHMILELRQLNLNRTRGRQ